jgi:hypothetical protein
MLTVQTITKTCEAAPAQWEGRTTDDRPIYVRYRYGFLSVQLGPPGGDLASAIRTEAFLGAQLGGELDGVLSYDELQAATAGEIAWPEEESPDAG